MYKIEKNVQCPAAKDRKYPFSEMEIGDSFLAPDDEIKSRGQLANIAAYHGRKLGQKYRTHTVPGGIRCWRIA